MSLFKPYWQAILFISITAATLIFFWRGSSEAMWLVAGCGYAGFILLNSVLIWTADHTWRYFFTSMVFSMIYIIAAGILVFAFLTLKPYGSNEAAIIFLSGIYHPVALLTVMFTKWMISRIKGRH